MPELQPLPWDEEPLEADNPDEVADDSDADYDARARFFATGELPRMSAPTVTLTQALSSLRWAGAIKSSVLDKMTETLTWLYREHGNYTTHVWGYDPRESNREHHSGYAVDLMTFSNREMGDKLYAYLMANAARLGVIHVLWQQSITSTVIQPGVRRPMADRGDGTKNHMDHLHVMFAATAYRAPMGPASPIPNVPGPAPTYDRAKTAAIQRLLKVGADGYWGNDTDQWAVRMRTAARAHLGYPRNIGAAFREDLVQTVIGVTADNIFGPMSKAALREWVKALQRLLGVDPDGKWGPGTDAAFFAFRTANRNNF